LRAAVTGVVLGSLLVGGLNPKNQQPGTTLRTEGDLYKSPTKVTLRTHSFLQLVLDDIPSVGKPLPVVLLAKHPCKAEPYQEYCPGRPHVRCLSLHIHIKPL